MTSRLLNCLKVVRANTPCSDRTCSHPVQIMRYEDGNGFFSFRPCSLQEELPWEAVMHDKVGKSERPTGESSSRV